MIESEKTQHHENNASAHKIPTVCLFLIAGSLLSLLLVIIAKYNEPFATSFNRHIGAVLRALLAHMTNIFPFSLAEFFIFLLPVIVIGVIYLAVRHSANTWRSILVYFIILLSALSLLFSIFVFGFGTGYYAKPIEEQLGLEAKPVSAEELKETAIWLAEEINQYRARITYLSSGASTMPYSLSEMSEKLMIAYQSIAQKYPFIQDLRSNIKPVMSSVVLSHLHITGVYSFFTGEANLNVDFPDYTLPFTAAHEFAHQRGVARENEANFVAFLVCIESNDPYLQYCGYLNLYEYVISALYSADPQMYREVHTVLSPEAKCELRAYSAFYDKYRESSAAKVGNAVNNAYLQANGNKEGIKSYGMVVDLAVAYYCSFICCEPS